MNGFSLMIAVAAMGIDVGWEAGPGGQQYYTIRVEQVLLEPLRKGQAIVSKVEASDRDLRRFQVALGDKPIRYDANQQPSDNMVKYGWRPNEKGGLDFMIQLTPERLETLASGIPVVGQVDPQVSDIRQIYIFAGVDPLPQELPDDMRAQPEPPQYLRGDGALEAASAQIDESSRATSRNASSRFGDTARAGSERGAAIGSNPRPGDLSDRYREDRSDWQHSDQRSNSSWNDEGGRSGPTAAGDYASRDSYSRNGEANRDRGYSSARFAERNPEYPRRDEVNRGSSAGTLPQQQYRESPAAPAAAYQPQVTPAASPGPSLPPATQQPVAPPAPNWQQGYAAAPVATVPTVPAVALPAAATPAVAEPAKEEVRPWTPLILTTLTLFASMGANAYLGWLAWSFFWRYRDAASDVARARMSAVSNRAA